MTTPVNPEEKTETNNIANRTYERTEVILILSTDNINIGLGKKGFERRLDVKVQAFGGDAHNVYLEVIDNGGLHVEPENIDVLKKGDWTWLYVKVNIIGDTKGRHYTIWLQAKCDETESNPVYMEIDVYKKYPSELNLNFVIIGSAIGGLSALGAVGATEAGRYGLMRVFFLPLYTRVSKDEVLDHFNRGRIYGYIDASCCHA